MIIAAERNEVGINGDLAKPASAIHRYNVGINVMGINQNLYAAEIKTETGGRVTVHIESDNSSHARQLLEMKYGRGNVINLRQICR